MPLDHYGVVAGTFARFDRDAPAQYGNFYHGQIFVNAPPPGGGAVVTYRCAVDVKMPDGIVEYVKVSIPRRDISRILHQASGYHDLARLPDSGAVDYVRSPYIRRPLGCASLLYGLLKVLTGKTYRVWTQNAGGSVLADLESILINVHRIYVFGERFYNANGNEHGMHDVHMNQGDPMPAQGDPDYAQKLGWYHNSGIWQDGGVIVEHDDRTVEGFFLKFLTQSLHTDDHGHPK